MSKRRLFRYPLNDCDVADCLKLAAYREKRFEWTEFLEEDKAHNVSGQLSALVWNDATFHLFNEMRKGVTAGTTVMRAPLLAEALDNGYVTNMVLGISRLTDPQPPGRNKGVVSLRRVLADIRTHRDLITREVYVCNDGLRYDPSTVPSPWERGYKSGVVYGVEVGGPFDSDTPERLHNTFDRLSGVNERDRSRTDLIEDAIFDEIGLLLGSPAIAKFRDLRNKFVAHSADANSRATASLPGFSITMSDVKAALRALLQAHHRIQVDILWASGGGYMPTAQFDVFEGLTSGLPDGQIAALREFWETIVQERDRWHE